MFASVISAERPGTQARKLVQSKHHDVEMSLRRILRGFGLKVGKTVPSELAPTARPGHFSLPCS
jgi:hypothetical protein